MPPSKTVDTVLAPNILIHIKIHVLTHKKEKPVCNQEIHWTSPLILFLVAIMMVGCGSESGIGGDDSIGVELNASSAEPCSDTLGKARFTYFPQCPDCPEGASQAYIIDGYTVAYIPIQSPDGQGGSFLPPALVNLDQKVLSQIILSRDFTTVERTIILVPIGTKNEYRNEASAQGITVPSLYSVRVTFFGRSRTGGDFSLTSTLELSFNDKDACQEP